MGAVDTNPAVRSKMLIEPTWFDVEALSRGLMRHFHGPQQRGIARTASAPMPIQRCSARTSRLKCLR
jgi:hypothetical protein